ncbi:MAG: prepilin-type N-terminal cleavage/methylation domain-containing protein [Proteobacteria bacterium]|nr:prepilin-type N-terminal cleavage/methylation domain-containing protein [Pseudomonadota bacterium]
MEKCGVIDNMSGAPGLPGRAGGFSLVELLIAMAVGLVVLGAMYSVFTIQNKTFGNQEVFVEMQQNVRAGMDMMAREIGMAGYNPAGVNFAGVTVITSQLQIQADLDGNGAIDSTSQENVIYIFDSTNKQITRYIGAGNQAFVENVDSFTFEYLKGDGTAATTEDVRRIRITITGRTAKPDPDYTDPTFGDKYRRYTLTSQVAPRNLAY